MSHEVFTEAWAQAWHQELTASDAYREAASEWEGSILLEWKGAGEGPHPGIFADLWHGECREARVATDEDRANADFIIRTGLDGWKQILAGKVDPIFGLMTGKIELARGSVPQLMPFMNASKELVAAAARIDSIFPED